MIGEKIGVGDYYARVMFGPLADEFYGQSDFFNFGYWEEGTNNAKEACETLMEKLLALAGPQKGKILDVACGKGATTAYLSRYYAPDSVYGIDITPESLERSKKNAPGSKFFHMDAANLEFGDEEFDRIVSVEAAFHFNTRRKFLEDAFRVLKPGGQIVLSDILVTQKAEQKFGRRIPQNFVRGPREYADILTQVGFVDTEVVDATEACSRRYFVNFFQFFLDKFRNKEVDKNFYVSTMFFYLMGLREITYYLLVRATKPVAAGQAATGSGAGSGRALG